LIDVEIEIVGPILSPSNSATRNRVVPVGMTTGKLVVPGAPMPPKSSPDRR
jgi:hypothetical protein